MGKMIAKTLKGKEFCYASRSAYSVPDRSADEICGALNACKYKLGEGEVWHVYECGEYERKYTYAGVQRIRKTKTGFIIEEV